MSHPAHRYPSFGPSIGLEPRFEENRNSPAETIRDPATIRDPGTLRPGEPRLTASDWRPGIPGDQGELRPSGMDLRQNMPPRMPVNGGGIRPAAARPAVRYVAIWAALGAISAAYLGAVSWQRSVGLEATLTPLTEAIERMANDIADLKQSASATDTREQVLTARLGSVETRLDSFARTAAQLPQATAEVQSQRPTNRNVLTSEPGPASPPPAQAPIPSPAAIAASSTEPLKPTRLLATAPAAPSPVPAAAAEAKTKPLAVAAAKIAPTPPVPAVNPVKTGSLQAAPVAARPSGLLIASGPSLESIRLSWSVLSQNHEPVLGGLEPRILPSTDGSAFHLIAGPFGSDADAQKACAALKSKGVGCKPADYIGAAL